MSRNVAVLLFLIVMVPGIGACLDYESLSAITGDTILVKEKSGKLSTFKISCIMAPYYDQQGWEESKGYLETAIQAKRAVIEVKQKTPEGYSGEMFLDGRDVCYMMVQSGYAFANVPRDNSINDFDLMRNPLYKIEREAKKMGAGNWANGNPADPWRSQARKTDESAPYRTAGEAVSASDSKKSPYQLCMERELGAGFEMPIMTHGLVGAVINATSANCGGKKLYNINTHQANKQVQQHDDMVRDMQINDMSNKIDSIDRRMKFGY